MPKKKKTAQNMTNEELAKKIFPKKVVEKLKEIAHEKEGKSGSKSSSQV
jgi:hypothetical protein